MLQRFSLTKINIINAAPLFHFPFTHAILITEQRYDIAWRCGNQILFSNKKDIKMEGCYVVLLTADMSHLESLGFFSED